MALFGKQSLACSYIICVNLPFFTRISGIHVVHKRVLYVLHLAFLLFRWSDAIGYARWVSNYVFDDQNAIFPKSSTEISAICVQGNLASGTVEPTVGSSCK